MCFLSKHLDIISHIWIIHFTIFVWSMSGHKCRSHFMLKKMFPDLSVRVNLHTMVQMVLYEITTTVFLSITSCAVGWLLKPVLANWGVKAVLDNWAQAGMACPWAIVLSFIIVPLFVHNMHTVTSIYLILITINCFVTARFRGWKWICNSIYVNKGCIYVFCNVLFSQRSNTCRHGIIACVALVWQYFVCW